MKMKENQILALFFLILISCNKGNENISGAIQPKDIENEIIIEKPKNLLSDNPIVYGNWNCSGKEIGFDSVFKLEFLGQKVIVTDFTGMSRNTSYEKINEKILLETGDVLSIQDDETIIFPMPLAQFYTTINCICTKISEK